MEPGNLKKEEERQDHPTGTVTFLFTDIEGSTQLLLRLGEHYATLLADHHRLFREIITCHYGREVDTQGDAFCVVFSRAGDAVGAAAEAQQAFAQHPWPGDVTVRVRMGLHTGEPMATEEGYVGMDLHRAARIATVGHGGQVLLSQATASLVRDDLPEGIEVRELGRYELKGIGEPEAISQLMISGCKSEFLPLQANMVVPARHRDVSLRPPDFLTALRPEPMRPPFVAREGELAWLEGYLESTYQGEGQMVFVTGEAGAGKTALLTEFIRRVEREYPDLLVVFGQCHAYTGMGDPYLPFRQVMEMLMGDVEGSFRSGRISQKQAQQLWRALPGMVERLVAHGPALIGTFVSGEQVMERLVAGGYAKQANALQEAMVKQRGVDLGQSQLFGQYLRVLQEVAQQHPLLIVLDDLQWVDSGSIQMLFQLGRALATYAIMVIGAYRPDEVAGGWYGGVHPLLKVLAEFKRLLGDRWLQLDEITRSERIRFIEAYIDSEPNQLDEAFRRALYEHTEGQALFMVELLQHLQERGDLIWEEGRGWVESPLLDWEAIPARVEGIIEERIARLELELREVLTIGAIEGENFTAQVVARVQEVDEREILRLLGQELDRRHRLVREQGVERLGRFRLFRYRFRHSLFQQHLYRGLGEGERQLMHEDVGLALEALYGENAMDIAPQLAWHYTEAGHGENAVPYLLEAGNRANMTYAHREAIGFFTQAISFLKDLDDFERAARTSMQLGLTYQMLFDHELATQAFREGSALWQRWSVSDSDVPAHDAVLQFGQYHDHDIHCFHPHMSARGMVRPLFSSLVRLSATMEVVPDVATSWELSADGCRYLFRLRDDVAWSDGGPVTAGDFVYAIQSTLRRSDTDEIWAEEELASTLYDIKGAKAYRLASRPDPAELGVYALDEHTLVFELEAPVYYFLYLLTMDQALPLPRHVCLERDIDWSDPFAFPTCGPYKFAEWVPGEQLVFDRNPYYHGRFTGNVHKVILGITDRDIKDWRWQLALYERDECDFLIMTFWPQEGLETALRRYGNEFVDIPWFCSQGICFDTRRPPFNDVRVRHAFTMAIDWRTILGQVKGKVIAGLRGGWVPPGMPGFSPDIGLPYDPDGARALLMEAGYLGGRGFPELISLNPDNQPDWILTLNLAAQQLCKKLGITVRSEFVRWQDWDEAIESLQPHLISHAWWGDYPDPDSFLRLGTQGIRKLSGWQDATFARMVDEARYLRDQEKRLQLYRDADRILIDQAPMMIASYSHGLALLKPWVRRYPISPLPPWDTPFWQDVIIEPR